MSIDVSIALSSVLSLSCATLSSAYAVRYPYPYINARRERLYHRDVWSFKDSGTDVGVLARGRVAAAQVERTAVLVLAVVAARIEHDAGRIIVAVVARAQNSELPVQIPHSYIKGADAPSAFAFTPVRVISGDGNRRWRTCSWPRCCRPSRTHRCSGSGRSCRPH